MYIYRDASDCKGLFVCVIEEVMVMNIEERYRARQNDKGEKRMKR